MLFLHGAGERGTDNALQLVHGPAISPRRRIGGSTRVLSWRRSVRCDRRWVEVDWALPSHTHAREPSVPLRLALELVDKLAAELPVDKGRLYITGLSMGGFGTWDAIQRRPDTSPPPCPICGGGDAAQAPKLKNLPIWAFHGDEDSVVPAQPHHRHDRGHSQGRRHAEDDHLSGRRTRLVEPHLRRSGGAGLAVRPEELICFARQNLSADKAAQHALPTGRGRLQSLLGARSTARPIHQSRGGRGFHPSVADRFR